MVLAVLAFNFQASSQDDEFQDKLILTVAPLSVLDFAPRYRFGVEYTHEGRFSYLLDIGFGNQALNGYRVNSFKYADNYRLFEIRPQVKLNFGNFEFVSHYVAVEGFLIDMRATMHDGFFQDYPTNTDIGFSSSNFHKVKMGGHLVAGERIVILNKMSIDFYFGVGAAHRFKDYYDTVDPVLISEHDDNATIMMSYTSESCQYIGHLTMGLKIGYIF